MRWPWRRDRRPERDAPEPPALEEQAPHDPLAVLAALHRHEVEYVLIGGMAVQTHGHVRTTRDVDVLARPDRANLERLAAALADLQARLRGIDAHLLGIDPTSPDDLAAGANFGLATRAGTVDVFTDPDQVPGARAWEQLRADALEVRVGGYSVPVAGRDDLLAMKAAAGRPKDLDDIAALTDPAALERELGAPELPDSPRERERQERAERAPVEPPSWER